MAAQEVLAHSGADELIVYGYCFGAVLSLLFVGGHPEIPLRALGIMATPIDFSLLGATNTLFAQGRIDLDSLVDETGNVPANYVLEGLKTRNITGDLVGYANLLNRLDDSEYIAAHQALIGWSQDHIPFAGGCFRQTVKWFMEDNRLVRGEIEMGGRTFDLRSIELPGAERHRRGRPPHPTRVDRADPRAAAADGGGPLQGRPRRVDRRQVGAEGVDPRDRRLAAGPVRRGGVHDRRTARRGRRRPGGRVLRPCARG